MVWVDSYFPCVQRAEAGAGGGGEGAAGDAGWEPVYARSLGGSREAPPRPVEASVACGVGSSRRRRRGRRGSWLSRRPSPFWSGAAEGTEGMRGTAQREAPHRIDRDRRWPTVVRGQAVDPRKASF